MKKLLLAFGSLTVLICVLFGVAGRAQAESITNFQSNTVIGTDSVATITETIDYDFGDTSHHGILRLLELSTQAGGQSGYYNLNFKLLNVSQDSNSVDVASTVSGFTRQLKIGDPSNTISGPHRYVIQYQLWPVVVQDPAGDYINQNITGNNWQVPIQHTSAQVTLPTGVIPTQLRCYTGSQGSTAQNCTITSQANIVSLSVNTPLSPGQGLTSNVLTPSGSFSQYLRTSTKPINDSSLTESIPVLLLLSIVLGILAFLVGCIMRLISMYQQRKARKNETVIAQYEPPDGLLPAEMGVLLDNKTNMAEITATIIDLAVRGYLKIQKTGKKDYSFTLLKSDSSGLQDYEKILFDMFLANSSSVDSKTSVVQLSKIDGKSAAGVVDNAKSVIVNRLVEKGYYVKGKTSTLKGGAGIGGAIAVCVFLVIFFRAFIVIAVPFIGIYLGYIIAKTSKMTQAGYDEWALVAGFKLFLSVTETDRLKFSDAPKKNPQLFNKLLPSAIALGVEKEWANQFKGIDISKAADWYVSDTAFDAIILSSLINSDLTSSLNSNFSAPSTSSGDFGGGGFSGGGSFGGGGGGSW